MKICSKCALFKDEKEFHRRGSKLKSWCKTCQQLIHAKHYNENREHRIKRARIRNELIHIDAINLLNKLKSAPCADCNKTFDIVCMDFDHVLSPKLFNIADYVCKKRISLKTLITEIGKCELVCACCHRVRTKLRNLS